MGGLKNKMMFLGDYVDRGRHSTECVCLLLALKCRFPTKYHLLRGNHESRCINFDYGFHGELTERFGDSAGNELWEQFNQVFDLLPLAGLVGKKILCMHGGISSRLTSLEAIEKIKRPITDVTSNLLVQDLLWSDPMHGITGYKENLVRGISVFFGEDTVHDACKRLDLDLIVRGHQMVLTGFSFFAGRKLITIFTAPRYQAGIPNIGAILKVQENGHIGFMLLQPTTKEEKAVKAARKVAEEEEDDDTEWSDSCWHGKEKEGAEKMQKKRERKSEQDQQKKDSKIKDISKN